MLIVKEEGGSVGDYREVMLTQTAYKVYAVILAEKLKEEVKRKDILPPSQKGFRKGMETTDNICIELSDE